jgi:NAD(P)-dependent dehydrogenase (short-subunit alcohol dehydrogenase family)
MEIRGSRVVVLGGTGLVGMAIVRELLPYRPERIVVSGLTRGEAREAEEELRSEAAAVNVVLFAEWGDLFLPRELKERSRSDILGDADARSQLLDDIYSAPPAEAVERSTLGAILLDHRPEIIVDCVNTATIFAYQNVFASASELRRRARAGVADVESVERHLATLYLPQLIRHVQLALEAMRRAGTQIYLKIGTSGTGGMGLNIPFTHSEERPSRMLLAKSSVAGAHTLLLYLMARTPNAPAVKEIKPTAAVSWKRITFGEVVRRGIPVYRVDATRPVPVDHLFDDAGRAGAEGPAWRRTGEVLRGVFLDAGENGLFTAPEFETLTSLGLMEFITPEEIAEDVVREIRGYPTGHDVVAALDAATTGPTYRAGVMRQFALGRMEELERANGVESVAYEMLGPPRLSKLLFEAAILRRVAGADLRAACGLQPEETARSAHHLIERDDDLRTRILSIGLPILLPDGRSALRGAEVKVGRQAGGEERTERLIENGWVDLRPSNWARWSGRIRSLADQVVGVGGPDLGSTRDLEGWQLTGEIRPGALAAWVLRSEDGGVRIKR